MIPTSNQGQIWTPIGAPNYISGERGARLVGGPTEATSRPSLRCPQVRSRDKAIEIGGVAREAAIDHLAKRISENLHPNFIQLSGLDPLPEAKINTAVNEGTMSSTHTAVEQEGKMQANTMTPPPVGFFSQLGLTSATVGGDLTSKVAMVAGAGSVQWPRRAPWAPPDQVRTGVGAIGAMAAARFDATLDALPAIRELVRAEAVQAGLEPAAVYRLLLAVDEFATNIVLHGYQEHGLTGSIDISVHQHDDSLHVVIEDDAVPFDPTARALPDAADLHKPLEERPVGGLGILLAFESVDEHHYSTAEGRNRNELRVHRGAPKRPVPCAGTWRHHRAG